MAELFAVDQADCATTRSSPASIHGQNNIPLTNAADAQGGVGGWIYDLATRKKG